jgi:hypothetical protein
LSGRGSKYIFSVETAVANEGEAMSTFTIDDNAAILVEFEPRPGAYEVSVSPQDIAQKSAEALAFSH